MRAPAGTVVTEEGRRVADTVRLHIAGGQAGRWLAFRLSDGGTDGVVYDDRAAAIRYQLHESQCAYIKIPYDTLTDQEASRYLVLCRMAYDAGLRFTDPESARHDVIPGRM